MKQYSFRESLIVWRILFVLWLMTASVAGAQEYAGLDDVRSDILAEDETPFKKSVEEASLMIDQNAGSRDFVLLDVRTPQEFDNAKIEGALNLDFYNPVFKNGIELLDPEKTYLIYCRTQNRSQKTAVMMDATGFREVYYMHGGITEWMAKDYPTVSSYELLASDGFESKNFTGGTGWNKRWFKKGKVRLVKKNPYEGKRYVRLLGGRSTASLKRKVDLSGYASARLTFASRIKSFEKNDKALVKVSPDGVKYTTVMKINSDQGDGQWHLLDIDLSGFEMTADFRVLFETDMGSKKDLWFLDDIRVEAYTQSPGEQFTLDVITEGLGSVAIDPDNTVYDLGTMVILTANMAPGWAFDHWEGDIAGDTNPAVISMDSDKVVTAVFVAAATYSLNVSTTGQGQVTLDPAGGVYNAGTEVKLTATGEPGWKFDHWEGDLSGSKNPVKIAMLTDKNLEAVFTQGTPPVSPTITSIPKVTDASKPIIINGKNFDTSTSRVYLEGDGVAEWATVLTRKPNRITIKNLDYINGTYQVTVYNGDVAGNTKNMIIDCG